VPITEANRAKSVDEDFPRATILPRPLILNKGESLRQSAAKFDEIQIISARLLAEVRNKA